MVGNSIIGQIIRFTTNDDVIGGALPSGTVVYYPVFARISGKEPTQALLEQGLETPEIFRITVTPGNLQIQENDQFHVVSPHISPYYNLTFRIIGVQHSSMLDPRSYQVLTLRRITVGNKDVYQ
jgi:hypothetical protein